MLPLAEVLSIIYHSKREHGIRVEEDHTRVRALTRLIDKMKAVLEFHKGEVEDGFGEHVVSEADNDDSKRACPIGVWSETSSEYYTVRSIASCKERTSWFFRLTRGKKKDVV
jgi:hypothetical protein